MVFNYNLVYQLLYHPRATKFIKQLSAQQKEGVAEKIKKLGTDPFTANLNVKKLVNTQKSLRLRVGNLRVIFEINPKTKIIYIQDIGFRGSIY